MLHIKYGRRFYRQMEDESFEGYLALVRPLLELVAANSAVDFGCGTGGWLAALAANGVVDVLGVDGPWVPQDMLKIPSSQFRCHDLTKPLTLERRFDLAMSLEVAEHLPASSADAFVALVASAAPAVLFSAAIPGQGGVDHINEQWPSYWAEKFKLHGYLPIDTLRSAIWNETRIASCVRQNVILYVDESLIASSPALADARAATNDDRLHLVHPDEFTKVTDPRVMSLRRTVREVPGVIVGALSRRV